MALDLFLNGPICNIITERTREIVIRIPITGATTLTLPTLEIIRARSRRVAVPELLVPVATVVGATEVTATFTEDIADGLQDLAGEGRASYLKYRFGVTVDSAPARTIMCGRLVVGPVGFGQVTGDVITPTVAITIGDIVFGETTTVTPPSGTDPEDGTMWTASIFEAWAADVYATWA